MSQIQTDLEWVFNHQILCFNVLLRVISVMFFLPNCKSESFLGLGQYRTKAIILESLFFFFI